MKKDQHPNPSSFDPQTRQSATRRKSVRVLLFVAMLTAAAAVAALAAGGFLRTWRVEAARQDGGPVRKASDPVTPEPVNVEGDVAPGLAQGQASGPVYVFIEFNEAPTTQVYAAALEKSNLPRGAAEAAANRAAQAHLTVVEREQGLMVARLTSRFNLTELYRTQRVLNGIAVTVDASQVEAIRATPGVKAVLPIVEHYPTNSTSVPFIKSPQLWDNSLGIMPDLTGRNIKVGIIDTGIDYIHSNFGGTGALADYTANNRTTNADGFFPTAKVVGGFDFAGDAYTGGNTPAPDPDPMDCNGHGSHVAGTAAGLGVLENGTGFTGPYGILSPFGGMRIGPGAAPGASLYALRVFGCAGGTNLTTQAIEWSVDPNDDGDFSDHLDVINMSLGGTYGTNTDASAAASNNAALAGVIVVTSAGNDGDTYFIHGSPGTAKRGISVAASSDNGQGTGPILRVNSPPALAGDKTATVQRNWGVGPTGQTANVVVVDDGVTSGQPDPAPSPTPIADTSAGTLTDACQPLTPASAAAVAGKIALADRGLCSIKTKTLNVQNAGAIGLIVNNNNTTDATPPVFADDQNITANITIPTVGVLKPVGDAIKAEPNGTVNVTLLSMADTLASFSSRGPRRGRQPLGLKPDITAPGLAITSTQTGTACTAGPNTCQTPNASGFIPNNQSLVLQGTSMAAPHIAGFMAQLRQLHPDWTVEELKALAMNGAVNSLYTLPNGAGTRFGLSRIGAGRVDAVNSATNTAVAYDADDTGAVSVSAFENEVVGTVSGRSRTIRVVNKGTTDVTYTLGLDTVNNAPGVSFSLPGGTSLTVPAGQARTFTVALDAVADQMDHVREATMAATQLGNGRHYLTEEGAYVTFTADSQVRMRVPVYAAPRPASQMEGTSTIITGAATSGQTSLALSGQDVCTGTRPGGAPDCVGSFPTDVVSLVTPFELQVNSPAKGDVPAHSDLHHVGVSSDGTNIFFGLSSYGDWTWPSDVEFDVYIDTNEDGTYDRVAFNSFLTNNAAGVRGTDVFITAILNAQTFAQTGLTFLNGFAGTSLDTAVYNNNSMVMVLPISSLGFTSGDTSFRYRIVVFDRNTSGSTDSVGFGTFGGADSPLTFNYAAPGLNFPSAPSSTSTTSATMFADMDGRTIPVNFNKTNLTANRSLGGLLLHHHNARGTRSQAFAVQNATAATTDIGVGVTVNNPNPPLNSDVNITVTASNVSTTNATGVTVLDELPAGLEFVSASTANGTYDDATGIWNIGALNAGASATLQIVATVRTTDPITNTARVAGADQLDINPANDQASAAVTAPHTADLGVTLSAAAPNANPGQSLTYTATVTNNGDDTANNVVVNIVFSPAATITASSASSGVFNPATGVWNVAGLGKGVSATLTVTITVPVVPGGGDLTATATIASADTADPNSVNNADTETVSVAAAPTIQFSDATYTVTEGAALGVIVTVTRTGGSTGAVTVDFATSDGTATAGQDYTDADTTLTFADGETSKSVNIPIANDSVFESDETVNLTLSNVTGIASLGSPSTATLTIVNDDAAPSFTINDVTVGEGNAGTTPVTFTVTKTGSTVFAATVDYATADGTATQPGDYAAASGTLNFATGDTSKTVTVLVNGDSVNEADETFFVNLSAPTNATVSDGQGQGTITNDDAAPGVSVNDVTLTEGNAGTTNAVFSVSLSAASEQTVTVDYATADGTATAGSDYVATSGTVTFNPGQTVRTFNVAVNGDTTDEADENFFVNLSNLSNATIGDITDAQGVGTITDDDAAPTLSVGDVTVTEGNSGTTSATFNVTLSAASGQTVTVNYATADGTASGGADYVAAAGSLTFAPGETSKSVNVNVNGDTLDEPNETFFVNLSSPSNATVSDNQGQGTITDDDGAAALSVSDVTLNEGNSGTTTFTFTVTLAPVSGQTVTVNYATANGTASAGSDYAAASGTLTFAPGETTKTVTVNVNGDSVNEADETFFVNLSGATNATVTDGQGLGTITNDDASSFQFSQAAFTAGEGENFVTVTVTRTGDASGAQDVNYATSDGSATARKDYTSAFGTLHFAAGETSKTFVVLLTDDAFQEGVETINLTLSNPTGGAGLGGASTATVQIQDNDTPPSTTNPIDRTDFFVRQHYHDFLNREPDPSGFAFWQNEIESCGANAQCREAKRVNVSAAFFLSIEFQGTGGFVYHTYTAAFGPTRVGSTVPLTLQEFLPDAQQVGSGVVFGQAGAEALLESNKQAYLLQFVQRSAFTAQYPNSMTPAQFVDALNANTGNSLTQSQRDALVAQLTANNTTQGRADVLRQVVDNSAFQARERNRSFVLMQYFGYLRRNPNDSPDADFSGYNFWLNKLNSFNGDYIAAEMVKAFISSAEYRQRFGQ